MNEKEFKLFLSTRKDYIGCYIKFYRERVGLSQIKLAKALKTSAVDIGLYELGTKIPNGQFIDKLYSGINKYIEENQIEIIR